MTVCRNTFLVPLINVNYIRQDLDGTMIKISWEGCKIAVGPPVQVRTFLQ